MGVYICTRVCVPLRVASHLGTEWECRASSSPARREAPGSFLLVSWHGYASGLALHGEAETQPSRPPHAPRLRGPQTQLTPRHRSLAHGSGDGGQRRLPQAGQMDRASRANLPGDQGDPTAPLSAGPPLPVTGKAPFGINCFFISISMSICLLYSTARKTNHPEQSQRGCSSGHVLSSPGQSRMASPRLARVGAQASPAGLPHTGVSPEASQTLPVTGVRPHTRKWVADTHAHAHGPHTLTLRRQTYVGHRRVPETSAL